MSADTPFQWALVGIVVLTSAIAGWHRRRAARDDEPISPLQEGTVYRWLLRVSALGLWLATLGQLLVPGLCTWCRWPLPAAVRWMGVLAGLLGAWGMHWSLASLGRNLTDTVVVRRAAELVTSGAYRWVRHPYYVVAGWLMGSVTLLTGNWLIGVNSLAVLGLLVWRTPLEEAELLARFGQEYKDYCQRTGRFWPRWPTGT
jgi:protein-S-isoprenylcysteine O-methyltransferase Ste14